MSPLPLYPAQRKSVPWKPLHWQEQCQTIPWSFGLPYAKNPRFPYVSIQSNSSVSSSIIIPSLCFSNQIKCTLFTWVVSFSSVHFPRKKKISPIKVSGPFSPEQLSPSRFLAALTTATLFKTLVLPDFFSPFPSFLDAPSNFPSSWPLNLWGFFPHLPAFSYPSCLAEAAFPSVLLLLVSSTTCLHPTMAFPSLWSLPALAWLPPGRTDPHHRDGSRESCPRVRVTHLV